MIWKAKIPYKVSCFTWLLAKHVVLTQENLMKRGIQLSPRCFLCGEKAETVTHLFLHCRITNQLWHLFVNKKEIELGDAKESNSSPEDMEQLFQHLWSQGEMENHPSLYLVVNVVRKEP